MATSDTPPGIGIPADLDLIAEVGSQLTAFKARRADLAAQTAECDEQIELLTKKLAGLVKAASEDSAELAAAVRLRTLKRRTVKSQVKSWFSRHPEIEARVTDLIKDGVGKNANALRPTLHRLREEGYLEQPDTGLFKLAVKEAGS